MKKIRVIQCYTGDVAKRQIKLVMNHPALELVGTLVFHEEKSGMDVGDIVGIEKTGVITTNKLDDILAIDADVVLYNALLEQYHEVIQLLASGKNVIQICGGYNPKELPEYEALKNACETGNASFMSTGVNPGYAPDVLPMVASALCSEIEHMHVRAGGELSLEPPSRLDFMGFGKPVDQGQIEPFEQLYKKATFFMGEALGLELDDVIIEPEFEPSLHAFNSPLPVAKGNIAGIRINYVGIVAGKRRLTFEITWFLGADNVRSSWLGEARTDGWVIDIKGKPDIKFTVDIGSNVEGWIPELTANRVINDIRIVCGAKQGPITFLDSPIPRNW